MTILNIKKDIINKTIKNPLWSSDQELPYVCDWYGKTYYGVSVSCIVNEIVNDYNLERKI
jgi:hypothetical protein